MLIYNLIPGDRTATAEREMSGTELPSQQLVPSNGFHPGWFTWAWSKRARSYGPSTPGPGRPDSIKVLIHTKYTRETVVRSD